MRRLDDDTVAATLAEIGDACGGVSWQYAQVTLRAASKKFRAAVLERFGHDAVADLVLDTPMRDDDPHRLI